MVDVDNASAIIKKEYPEYPISRIIDIGNRWAFILYTGENPEKELPILTVTKWKGVVGTLPIPPMRNYERIRNGKVVYEWASV